MSENNNITKYIPNFITLLCLSSGFTSIMYSLNNEWIKINTKCLDKRWKKVYNILVCHPGAYTWNNMYYIAFKTPDFIISSNDLACAEIVSETKINNANNDLSILFIIFPLLYLLIYVVPWFTSQHNQTWFVTVNFNHYKMAM